MSGRWTVKSGRNIYFDGQPFISVDREGDTRPVESDSSVHFIVECLNHAQMTPDELYRRHMGHMPKRSRTQESRQPGSREARRSYSMTYGTLPPYEKFIEDIRRPDPDETNGESYWPEGTLYPMELVDDEEIALAEGYGGLQPFTPSRYAHKSGFRGDEREIYGFLQYLVDAWNNGNEPAGDLASSIMTTLGYEWI